MAVYDIGCDGGVVRHGTAAARLHVSLFVGDKHVGVKSLNILFLHNLNLRCLQHHVVPWCTMDMSTSQQDDLVVLACKQSL